VKNLLFASVAVVLGSSGLSLRAAAAEQCAPPAPGEPIFITDECTEPRFNDPFIDIDEMRSTPVEHRYVHGGFRGTDARFAFYFPPPEQYEGRFIQGPTHQLTPNENLGNSQIAFVIASGGYAVQTNMGGTEAATATEDVLFFGKDPAVVGYRVNAAAAKYSRVVAAEMYGAHRPYGYLHGGSGGAYQTISSLENTTVWDGGIPFVLGNENSIPTAYTVRIHAQRIIGPSGKFPCILDAYDPGGSGDPAGSCNLTKEQAEALQEANRLGFPKRGWFGGALTGAGALPLIAGYVPYLDPNYTNDFWSQPGYLGHDDPYGSLAPARIIHNTTVTEKLATPNRLRLASFPQGDRTAIDLQISSGAGAEVSQVGLPPGFVRAPLINATELTVTIPALGAAIYNAVKVGDQVALDNSGYLALQTYHRHQIGGPKEGYYTYDQFRDSNGQPIYPQREVLTGPVGQYNGSGGHMTGIFNGKMIIQQSLLDVDAHPWGADWYKKRVERVLGKRLDDRFRLYFQDHAQHGAGSEGGTSTRTVAYNGALQHALRDLAAWVEQGVKPPVSTSYEVVDGQVVVPPNAGERKGIQPVVTLEANRGVVAEVEVGQAVRLVGTIRVPPGTGKVVKVEWNVEGASTPGAFVATEFGDVRPSVRVETTHTYTQPGTYFPVLRGTSQRESYSLSPFARIENIARARVVVR
jgi:hypothetical protein